MADKNEKKFSDKLLEGCLDSVMNKAKELVYKEIKERNRKKIVNFLKEEGKKLKDRFK